MLLNLAEKGCGGFEIRVTSGRVGFLLLSLLTFSSNSQILRDSLKKEQFACLVSLFPSLQLPHGNETIEEFQKLFLVSLAPRTFLLGIMQNFVPIHVPSRSIQPVGKLRNHA